MTPFNHEWSQIDQGEANCVRCGASSSLPALPCRPQIPVAKADSRDTLWREADRLARQTKGLSERLFALRDELKPTTAS